MQGHKVKSFTFLFALMLSISSCGLINWGAEYDSSQGQYFTRKASPEDNLHCQKNTLQFYSNSKITTEIFETFYQNKIFQYYTDEEFLVSFILLHFITRPDLIAPNSRIQKFSVNHNDHQHGLSHHYRDWSNPTASDSLLIFLEDYLSKNSSKSLVEMAKNIDRVIPNNIPVETNLQKFLAKNSEKVANNNILKSIFIRGNQTIKVGESFTSFSLERSIQNLRQNISASSQTSEEKYSDLSHLFGPFDENGELKFLDQGESAATHSLFCSFDLSLYSQGIFLPGPSQAHETLEIGMSNGQLKRSFLTAITTNNTQRKLEIESHLIQANPSHQKNVQKASFCHTLNLENQKEFIISASRSRDPGQIIIQLLNQDLLLADTDTVDSLSHILNRARTLKLSRPLRLLYEEARGNPDMLQSLYNKNIPLYYARKIGSVHLHLNQKSPDFFGPILDNRWDMSLKCIN